MRIIRGVFICIRHAAGVFHTPYTTCRTLSKGESLEQMIPIGLIALSYFVWSALVHHGVSVHPLLLTFSFGKIVFYSVTTYILVVSALIAVSRMVGGTGTIAGVVMLWTYSLLPTIVWFYGASLLWLFFPPPRTASIAGQMLSFVFLVFSLYLFLWKGVLYYLTLRFGMRLGFWRIMLVSFIIFPLGFYYALIMYRLGIFRVPFI